MSAALVPMTPQVVYPAEVISLPAEDTWEYWLPRWISRKSDGTKTVYATEMKAFLAFSRWTPIRQVTTTLIEEYQQFLVSAGLKPNTIARRIASVCSCISYVYRRAPHMWRANPGISVERVKPSNELAGRILTEAEVIRMFDRTSNPRDLALLRTLYSSGCRISEVCGLRWQDVVWKDDSVLITVLGKGAKVRTIHIYGAAVQALRAILPPGDIDPSLHVFRTAHGPLGRIYAVEVIRRAAIRAGITRKVSPHWWRHAAATHALERGAPLPLVSQTLGHANLSTTGKYLHCRPGESMGRYLAV